MVCATSPAFRAKRTASERQSDARAIARAGLCLASRCRLEQAGREREIALTRADEFLLFFAGSTAKGVVSSLVHALVAAGGLDFDLRLAEVWPEFAAHGEGNVTVRHVLMHQAGVPGLPPDLTTEQLCDWDHMCAVVAEAATCSPRRSRRSAR
jgi:CubicO group peptidase (beta-lactamase class C family)